MDKNKILHITNFAPDLYGHGGNRRTAQIAELLKSADFTIESTATQKSNRFARYFYGIFIWTNSNFKSLSNFRILGQWGQSYINFKSALKQHSVNRVALWESTADYFIADVAKNDKYKIIAVPQNIESLVKIEGGNCTLKSTLKKLGNEIIHLAKSDAIFCISREEQWLLKLFNIEANFLPYYPAKPILDQLLSIRKNRHSSYKSRFLVVGTASNPPTLTGLIEQIQILEKITEELDFEVDIVGYETEKIKHYCNNPSINFIGTVSSSKLNELMESAIAVLIHQKAGVGALTRIPEMLIAGIPVIANANACRSAYRYDGLYCYDNQVTLLELMKNSLSLSIPEILPRNISSEKHFIDTVSSISSINSDV